MVHPVQSVIESLYAAGRCPRLHVNATHAAVVCPEEIRHQWKERLIIDLDSSYPLDLTFGQTGLAANLSFGGTVTRCTFPWEAIYVVMDRATGRGIVLDRHVPESVRRQSGASAPAVRMDPEPETESTPERPDLRAVADEPASPRRQAPRPPGPASPPRPASPSRARREARHRRVAGQEAPRRLPRDRRRRLTRQDSHPPMKIAGLVVSLLASSSARCGCSTCAPPPRGGLRAQDRHHPRRGRRPARRRRQNLLDQLRLQCVKEKRKLLQLRGKIVYARQAKCIMAATTLGAAETCG
jgi:hypothetical protein